MYVKINKKEAFKQIQKNNVVAVLPNNINPEKDKVEHHEKISLAKIKAKLNKSHISYDIFLNYLDMIKCFYNKSTRLTYYIKIK